MSVFVQKLNPLTGRNDWTTENEDYDYHQEVARSAFADMLHDTERNQLYEKALKIAIDKLHSLGQQAKVLDIGTGTGLLSMMAARNGADHIIACEAFKPMSRCALKVIEQNGFKDKIRVIPKRSTDLTVGPDGDLKEKCNILVTEVFDTELIGEGAIFTFDHAHTNLLEKECIVIPERAVIYAQVVECPLAQNWNKLKDVVNDDLEVLVRVPQSVQNCGGSSAVHDIQLNQLPLSAFNIILQPTAVLEFDWSGKSQLLYERSTPKAFKALRTGKAQAVFMWWELQMDINKEHILSCAPYWAHPQPAYMQWRDHWMQAVYYLPCEIDVREGQEVYLISSHDEFSLWFNLSTTLEKSAMIKPVCECGLHVAFARTRIGQMNDSKRVKKYLQLFEEHLSKTSRVLILGDGFYCGLAAAKMGAEMVYFLDTNALSRRVLNQFIDYNNIKNALIVEDTNSLPEIDLVIGEPYFSSSILPWDNLYFAYLQKNLNAVKVYPQTCVIKAVAVKFDNLYKIREPLGTCEGFSMIEFDQLIMESSNISDDSVEAQPLWEYPCIALSKEVEVARIEWGEGKHLRDVQQGGNIPIESDLSCNGVALWVDWVFDDSPKSVITTGPIQPIQLDGKITWDMYTRQAVCLFSNKKVATLRYEFKFDFKEGEVCFSCF